MSKVLVISTSLHAKSSSDVLAKEFARGAQDAGHDVEIISLKGKQIAFCKGCLACAKIGHCTTSDDAIEIADKMYNADAICFATPIYYYEMCGQMKTLLDRCNSLYFSDYHFRFIYMMITAAENNDNVPKRCIAGLEGWIECFEHAHLSGTVFAGGINGTDDIKKHHSTNKAYETGKNCIPNQI